MLFFLLMGIFMILSGVVIIFKHEITISSLFLIPNLVTWFFIKLARGMEPEPTMIIRGTLKNVIGGFIVLAGLAFCFFSLTFWDLY